MVEEYGDFVENLADGRGETLHLSFWPGLTPLQQRWRNNGLSADFLGDYVTTFFPLDDSEADARQRQQEIRGAVSYVANELLENAMKFHDKGVQSPISILLRIDGERILFHETNGIGEAAVTVFKTFIERLRENDPGDLFVQQLEANALSDESAGLGFLTMINDYAADLAWRFEPLPTGGCRATTQVSLKI